MTSAAAESAALEVLLVHRPRYDDWSFPKGKLHKDEGLLSAAVREVSEETGLAVVVGHRLPVARYRTADGPKEVTYWTMQPVGGTFVPNDEVDETRWLSLAQAKSLLSYDYDRDLAEELLDLPPGVVRVLLVRHAAAGHRSGFRGPDRERPLVGRGRRQAQELVPLLSGFAPTRVLSARPRRCVETVKPLARSLGLEVTEATMFGEDEFADDPQAAIDALLDELASADGVAVIASQGGVIPALVSRLCPADALEPVPPIAAKAGTWALASSAGRIRADYYPPPKR